MMIDHLPTDIINYFYVYLIGGSLVFPIMKVASWRSMGNNSHEAIVGMLHRYSDDDAGCRLVRGGAFPVVQANRLTGVGTEAA